MAVRETSGDFAPGSMEEEERNGESKAPRRMRILWTRIDSKPSKKGDRLRILGYSGNFPGGGSDLILPQVFLLFYSSYGVYPGGGHL
jgi:hypothetical protein